VPPSTILVLLVLPATYSILGDFAWVSEETEEA
jgi:hypothetical protein